MANIQTLIADLNLRPDTPDEIRDDIASAEADIREWESTIIDNEFKALDLAAETIQCRADIELRRQQLNKLRAKLATRREVIQ